MKLQCPSVKFNHASLRKFITAGLNDMESGAPGPPVNELIKAETDEEHLSYRALKDALENVNSIDGPLSLLSLENVNSVSEQELAKICWDEAEELFDNSPFGLPYVKIRPLTAREWVYLYGEGVGDSPGVFNAFTGPLSTWSSLSTCGFLKSASPLVPVVTATSSSFAAARPVVGGVWGPEVFEVAASCYAAAASSAAAPDCNAPACDSHSDDELLFELKIDRHGRMEDIQNLRGAEYMRNEGFIWHVGSGPAARKVRWRFSETNLWKCQSVARPTVEELEAFLRPRFPEYIGQLAQVPFETSASEDRLQEGQWFRLIVSHNSPCPNFETSWHGSNLYVAGSIFKTGVLLPTKGSHGSVGIWSHKSSNRKLCGSYMYYILSGSGVAWGVMFEIRIDLAHTKISGSSTHQWVTEDGHATVHAAWFHGVTQDDFFPSMHIWPTWDPNLEHRY